MKRMTGAGGAEGGEGASEPTGVRRIVDGTAAARRPLEEVGGRKRPPCAVYEA